MPELDYADVGGMLSSLSEASDVETFSSRIELLVTENMRQMQAVNGQLERARPFIATLAVPCGRSGDDQERALVG